MFSDQSGIVLANVVGYTEAQQVGDQLKGALETRDTIGMAKGLDGSRKHRR